MDWEPDYDLQTAMKKHSLLINNFKFNMDFIYSYYNKLIKK